VQLYKCNHYRHRHKHFAQKKRYMPMQLLQPLQVKSGFTFAGKETIKAKNQ
jgi:hypothetical protein